MDPDSSMLGRMILIISLIGLNAFFTMAETAIVTLNDARLHKMAGQGHKKAMLLARLVEHPSRFFATVRVGLAFTGFFAFAISVGTFGRDLVGALSALPLPDAYVWAISFVAVGIVTALLILIFGEIVPKRIAARHHEGLAMFAAYPFAAFSWAVRPLVALLAACSGAVLRIFGIDPNAGDDTVTEEEIRMLLDEGSEDGNIEESDKDMINNIFDFHDTEVSELMVHRIEIVALETDASLQKVVETAVQSSYTRIPVYEGDLDNIVGILNVKDLIELITRDAVLPFDLKKYLREPFFVTESMSCKLLFSIFKEKKLQVAVVVDEYDGTAGIITMEDLLEGIVGSIQDEYDDDEEEEEILIAGSGEYLIDGLADLDEVCETLGLVLEEEEQEEFETIGGYIVHKLGYIPEEDEQPFTIVGDVLFTVRSMENRRISKLTAKRQTPEDEARDTAQESLAGER